ncbi:MAG: hypothetical protein AB1938_11710 [Myxococcota bacterium]
MSLKKNLQQTLASLRGRVSQRLPMKTALSIRIRSAFNIGEYLLAHPREALAALERRQRKPGFTRLHIFFRHVHLKHNARSRDPDKLRPDWFSHERCFENLLSTIERSQWAERTTLTVVYDGSEEDFASDFISRHTARRMPPAVAVKFVNGGSNIKSWLELLDHVRRDDFLDDEILFFMENDYLHVEGWLDKVVDLYDSATPFDYVSLYDHTDFYDFEGKPAFPLYRGVKSGLFVTPSHHWREAPSACGTFLVEKRVFLQDIDVWSSRLSDFYVFMYLRSIKRRVLVSPVPSLSTHCMAGLLAPTVDWASQ